MADALASPVERELERKGPRQWIKPYSARLPWLRCRGCGARLARMDVIDGRPCVRVGGAYMTEGKLVCRKCGAVRPFFKV